jgi:hypothetical protein
MQAFFCVISGPGRIPRLPDRLPARCLAKLPEWRTPFRSVIHSFRFPVNVRRLATVRVGCTEMHNRGLISLARSVK